MPNTATLESFTESHEAWHAELESQRTGPHGPLSVTAIHWLDENSQRLSGLPGEWSATREGLVTVLVEARDGLFRNGEPLSGESRIGPLAGIDSELLEWGEQRIQVAARGGRIAVRPPGPELARPGQLHRHCNVSCGSCLGDRGGVRARSASWCRG